MFTEHKAPGEVQITKLSQAIRIGARTIPEDTTWSGCALGTAAQAMGFEMGHMPYTFLIEKFPTIPYQQLLNISWSHTAGKSRLQIAADLEAQGL